MRYARHRRGRVHRLAPCRGAPGAGPRRRRARLLHRLLRPAAEGGERRARSTFARVDLAEDELDFAGLDGVFHLAGQPGVRSFGDVFPLYLRRNVLASRGSSRPPPRRRPRRLRLVVVGLRRGRALPDARGRRPGRSRRTGSRSSRASTSPRLRADFGLDVVVPPLLQLFGPRQRPDMAFTRVAFALAEGGRSRSTATAASRGAGRTSPTSSTATIARDGARRSGTYNVGGALEASMRDAIALLERIAGRSLDLRRRRACPATTPDDRRHHAHPRRPRLGAARRRSRKACAPSGNGPRLESAPDDVRPTVPDLDARRRSISRRYGRAIVAAGGCCSRASSSARSSATCSRSAAARSWKAQALISLGQPFSPGGGAPVTSFATNPRRSRRSSAPSRR